MAFARLYDVDGRSVVAEIIDPPGPVGEYYAAEFLAGLMPAPSGACEGWVLEGGELVPPPAPEPMPAADPLVSGRAAKLAEIAAVAEALLAAGYPTGGLHIAVDDGARADLTAMAATALGAAGGALLWPAAYAAGWITTENVRIPLPAPADGLNLAAAVGAWYAALVQHRRDLKDDALSAPDLAALAAIDAGAGWPD
ncbi:hypothetical protein V5F38_05005 [Xanthobacter sp. V0B-10]|uniref:DUF4376 domain-containing protein n=1 Tax=Xanthobacter albus TaxID=3119929 RepID=UPI00372974A1